jgi:hypothetical protein
MKSHCIKNSFICILFIFALASCSATKDLPKIKVLSVERVFHNGEHNAFTDLCKFNGQYYLAFRSCPDGHMLFTSSSLIVLTSKDGKDWEQVHQFSVPNRDVRDAHFLVFKDKLFVYTGTWYCESPNPDSNLRDINQHLGYCAWSTDGEKWTSPVMLEGTYGHYIWRAASHGDKAYLCGRRKHEFREMPRNDESRRITESVMLESDDGIIWKKAGLFQEETGDETAFLFEPDGSVLAIARRGRDNAEVCRSKPAYQDWDRTELDRYIGGPMVIKWHGHYLVGGRKMINEGPRTTVLYWLTDNKIIECAEFPSGGDNSYPGFVELSKNRALVSYYSSHEKDKDGKPITAIYLATIELQE